MFQSLSPQRLDEDHREILSFMEASYIEAISINQAAWSQGDLCWRFISNDQTVWSDVYGSVPLGRRRQLSFNRLRPTVNMITGHQRRTRKSIVVVGVENADSKTADQFTKVIMWAVNKESVLETISEAFEGALVAGMNMLQVYMDYREDPVSGNIKVDNCAYNTFIIDPYFKKPDLTDCRYLWKRSFLSKRECISLMPDRAEEIMALPGNATGGAQDNKFQFMPESYGYSTKNLLKYDEFYYRSYRTQKMLVDSQTGETMEWKSDDKQALDLYLSRYPEVSLIDQEIPTVNLCITIQGEVFYDGANPLGIDEYPFVPVFAYYAPQIPYYPDRLQSVVSMCVDAQYLFNLRKNIELDILASQINSGYIYKENSLVNPKDIFLSGQGKGLALKADSAMTDIVQIQSPAIPATTLEISRSLGDEINKISGVNEELLGSADDSKSGILASLRQGAGLTTLQLLFDQLDRSQRILGNVFIKLIQANFTPGKVKKILGGQEPTEQFYNKAFGTYSAMVEDGLNTTTQRQMQFAQMLNLREIGVPISPADLLEAATFQNKDRIIENIEKAEQAQMELKQKQAEMEMQLQQAQIDLAKARATADIGLGEERMSRIPENRSLAYERIGEYQKDMAAAELDRAKTLKELDSLDIDHLSRLIAMSRMVTDENQDSLSVEQPIAQQPIAQQPVEQQPIA